MKPISSLFLPAHMWIVSHQDLFRNIFNFFWFQENLRTPLSLIQVNISSILTFFFLNWILKIVQIFQPIHMHMHLKYAMYLSSFILWLFEEEFVIHCALLIHVSLSFSIFWSYGLYVYLLSIPCSLSQFHRCNSNVVWPACIYNTGGHRILERGQRAVYIRC